MSFKSHVNGKVSEAFVPHCGLRQGDLLSPFLFLFCMYVLSRMLRLGKDNKLIEGIKISRRAPSISRLFFADDIMMLFKVSEVSCSLLLDILDRFCKASGQELNLNLISSLVLIFRLWIRRNLKFYSEFHKQISLEII